VRFWDTSGLIPLLAEEPAREAMLIRLEQDPQILVWWGTRVEIASALARREREGGVAPGDIEQARSAVADLAGVWHEVVPSDLIRRAAERLVRTHPLRAADSLQLAAAWAASGQDPTTLELVCLDQRLAAAARREGFPVIDA
jgi:predicted nucleic acid-binding protein